MKNRAFIIFNDTHIKKDNTDKVLRSVRHMVKYAINNNIKDIIFAGDLMHSRTHQKLNVLKCVEDILNMFVYNGLTMHSIPGNHDKSVYTDIDNFQDAFSYHPAMNLYRNMEIIDINGISVGMLPFFIDDMINDRVESSKGGDILVSHFSVNGSVNLGHTVKSSNIDKKLLMTKFKKIYLGHFHNTNEINDNIIHLPSLFPQNFGEDNNKGFSVIYDDLSYEIIKGDFVEYDKLYVNLDKLNKSQIQDILDEHSNSNTLIRIILTGQESKLKVFDKNNFTFGNNISFVKDMEDIFEKLNITDGASVTKWDVDEIEDEFEIFCEEKDYDYKEGLKLLREFLNKQ